MTQLRYFTVGILVGCFALAGCGNEEPRIAGLPDTIDYNWHVRPILSDNCFACHGPDEAARKAGLRLDVAEEAFAELPETPGRYAIVPGNPGESELVRRITAENPEVRMPPQSQHKQLTALQVETLRAWVDEGAQYKKHWSFITPERPDVPEATFPGGDRNPIDAFVMRRLESAGLEPSAEADRETLINRVSLTLTGLPPRPDEVDAFVNDPDPAAYDKLVDRLLASDRYAEHMAGYWMDIARWSESDGFLDDNHDRHLWPWRDWVIGAFRDNMPYDQFATWQLAGDLLPGATRDQRLATAYIRLGTRTTENGAIAEEYKAEYMIERTDNALGTAFLGLTFGCARCHDHKYDPISQRDYYSMGAFFNSIDEPGYYPPGYSGIQAGPTLPWPTEDMSADIQAANAELERSEAAYADALTRAEASAAARAESVLAESGEALAALLDETLRASLAAYYPFDSVREFSADEMPTPRERTTPPRNPDEEANDDDNEEAGAESEDDRAAEVSAVPRAPRVRLPDGYIQGQVSFTDSVTEGVRPAVLQDPILRDGLRGQALYFNETNRGFLGRGIGWYDRTDPFTIDLWYYVAERYDHLVPVLNHRNSDNSGGTGYRLHLRDGRLWFRFAHSLPANMIAVSSVEELPLREWTHITVTYDGSSTAGGTRIYLNGQPAELVVEHDSLTRTAGPTGYAARLEPFDGLAFGGRFREKAPIGSMLDELRVFDKALEPIEVAYLHRPDEVASRGVEALRQDVAGLLVLQDEAVAGAFAALTQARKRENEIVSVVPQVLVMGDAPEPQPTYVLNRGLYTDPGERVYPRGGPEEVFPWDEALPENRLGLTQWMFDPSHPLTSRVFVNRMWQMHFGRGIVETSEDFGAQGSIPTHPELLDWLAVEFIESGWDIKHLHRLIVTSATYRQSSDLTPHLQADPLNELLARGPRWRMSAEMVRDNALAVSGLLDDELGGQSVYPYQPEGVWSRLIGFYSYPATDEVPADEHHRRSLYSFVKRNAPHPAMEAFDFADRTVSTPRRWRSNTPLQALVLMNDPQFLEAYRTLAESTLENFSARNDRVRWLNRVGARRTPTDQELQILNEYYQSQIAYFTGAPDEAQALVSVGVTEPDPEADLVELAALTNVAALIMNSPDAYTVR